MTWFRRAAIACGVLGPMVCTGALADDPVDDALSLVAQERHAEARKAIEDMLARNPDAPGVRLLQGVLHAREGNLVEAVAIFEGLRDDHPTMFEAHNNLAVLYAKLGRLDDARKALIGMKGDHGRPLGLLPDTLIVPPALEDKAREVVTAERNAAGATNIWKGTAEPVVVPWLA